MTPRTSSLHLVKEEERTPSKMARHSDISELGGEPEVATESLVTPAELCAQFSLSEAAQEMIRVAREQVRTRIETGKGAPVVIVGPCSIHCETAALEYAERLKALQDKLGKRVQLVMRVYLEKPRTTVGWKGFLYDPDLDGSDNMAQGLRRARALMVKISELGLPIATELLDPLLAPYIEDCLTWVAIGARTTESQIHRQMASQLPCAVGFKNGTDGSITTAIQASQAAERAHTHLGIDESGRVAMIRSAGNQATHVVLRGGRSGPNFDRQSVARVAASLAAADRRSAVMVDCSHGNSEKDYRRQPDVFRAAIAQMGETHADVFGVMVESHLKAGKQTADGELEYGMSVTDGCIDFATTEGLLLELAGL